MPTTIDSAEVADARRTAEDAAARCDRCAPYHGTWPWLRVLGLAATPRRHVSFYDAWLPTGPGDDVLVCGAADEVMAEVVIEALGRAGRTARVTVVDRCPTPIERCRRFGREAGIELDLVVADVLTHTTDERYDVVCTHSLLPILDPAARLVAARQWCRWLRPGGRVVTVARVALEGAPPARPQVFAEEVRERAAALLAPLGVDPDELAVAAAEYARTTVVQPFASLDEVAELFTAAGLTVEHLELATVGGPVGPAAAHPGTARAATYAELVARR